MPGASWRVFDVAELLEKKHSVPVPYYEFLRVPALSCGIYTLRAAGKVLVTRGGGG